MTSNAKKWTLNSIGLTIAILAWCGTPALALQDKISPVSDYQYKRDYAQVEGIMKEADPQKKADQLVAFMKEHPISKSFAYVAQSYMEFIRPTIQNKDWSKAITLIEGFMALMPTEKSIEAAAVPQPGAGEFIKEQVIPTRRTYQSTLLGVYYQANNLPKAAELAEQLYASTSDKSLLVSLADIYLKMQNMDKFMTYGEKVVAEIPIEQSYTMALQMAQMHMQKREIGKARTLYVKVNDAFGEKVPPGLQPQAWSAIRAIALDPLAEHSLPAAEAYGQKDYPKAIELYQKVAQLDPKRDDAYYYIGMSKWNTKDPEGAIESFAKAVVLGKANAKKAQQYMEDLYKARHSNSLDGLDQTLAKAKSDLGIN